MGLEQRVSVLECQQDKNEEHFCRIEGEISEFRKEVREQFSQVQDQFSQVQEQFSQVWEQFRQVRERFDSADEKTADMQAFNAQTQDIVRMIYFAVKHEEVPK
ncbi:hypothetical protein [Sansalvadorimonas verongulae]|uniref:hypothetical protein n=1 Tax=Sansalvadorimonas verongulae TaxID=2172824 RepID=UPI0012BC72FD|nr:hypothetical protein [Sansalvadorimonas verongulae]MTI12472.1 hypothetical protein [Sansalvadorimonas verongulae]